jgi:hypothetical protein
MAAGYGAEKAVLGGGLVLTSIRIVAMRVTIRIANRCDFLFCLYFLFFLSLPYMFRAFIGPSSGVSQAVVYKQPFGSCVGQ